MFPLINFTDYILWPVEIQNQFLKLQILIRSSIGIPDPTPYNINTKKTIPMPQAEFQIKIPVFK